MPQRNAPATILVLDSELGFMFALSLELSKRQIAAFPARSVPEARALIEQFQLRPDLLVMHCSRPGVCAFADEVAKVHPGLKLVGIVTERHCCRQCADRLAAQIRDPEDRGPERIGPCADVLENLVREQRKRAHRAGSKT